MSDEKENIFLERYRILIVVLIFIILFLILIFKLGSIQLSDNAKYNQSINTQSIRIIRIPAVRGQIKSEDGFIIADSVPSYNVVFHLAELRKYASRDKNVNYIYSLAESVGEKIGRKVEITKDEIIDQMNLRPAMPITVFTNLTDKEMAIASEIMPPIPGMEIVSIPMRYYPDGSSACHIIGYVGMDDPGEAPDKDKYSYYIPDIKGRFGLEKALDTHINIGPGFAGLRGAPGSKLVRVNVKGYVHDDMGMTEVPVNGNSVVLNINWKAQKIADDVLKGRVGSIVVLNADTGAVLVMASSPTFNSNDFTFGISRSEWKSLLTNKDKPLLDRAIDGVSPSGSIIKPLVALAALKAGIGANDIVYCSGAAKIGNAQIRCWAWPWGGHGPENMVHALRDSCNVYFVETGLKVGFSRLVDMYKHAGLGRITGLELRGNAGILPSKKIKMKIDKTAWTSFDTGLISIGQGMLALSPLQAALYTAAIANGGTIYRPYLVKDVYSSDGNLLYTQEPKVVDNLDVSQAQLDVVREGMHENIYAPYGGGKKAKNNAIELYGKTGTAQVGTGEAAHKNHDTWFIGFGTRDSKTYAIAVYVRGGVAGGVTNAPMAKEFFEQWLGVDSSLVVDAPQQPLNSPSAPSAEQYD